MAKKKTKADVDAATVIGSPEKDSAADRQSLLKSRLKIAKAFCKKPHEAFKKYIAEYEISNLDDTAEIRDKVRIGYVFRKTESEINAIFDDQPELFFKGRNKKLREIQSLFESVYDLLWDIQDLETVIDDAGTYFELLGMAFVDSPYVTKTKKVTEMVESPVVDEATGEPVLDEMGQPSLMSTPQDYEVAVIDNPVAETIDPFKVFFSPETKFARILDYQHCPYYFIEMTMTKEEIKAKFGKDVDPQEHLHVGETDIDTEIASEMKEHKDDLKRVTVYKYYGVLPELLAEGITDAAGNATEWAYDKDYEVYLTNHEELSAKECQYDVKPLKLLGNYGLANKFWKFGDAKHLMPLVQELEQYRSQILKHTRKMANPKPLIELNSEVDEEAFNDSRVGKAVKYANTAPSYLSPANLGSEVATGVDMVRTDLEKTAPGFDLGSGGGQSQVRSPRGIATFAEAADRGARKKKKKIARFIKDLLVFQFEQIGKNWKPEEGKTIDIEGEDAPVTAEVLQVLSDPQILAKLDIETESLSVNRVQQKTDAIELFDLAAQHPDVFNKMEMAKDLLQNGYGKKDADRYLIPEVEVAKKYIGQFLATVAGQDPQTAMALAPMVDQFQLVDPQTGQPKQEPGQAQPAQIPESTNGMPPMPNV